MTPNAFFTAGLSRYTPLVVCGNNEQLKKRLQERKGGHVIGWTDEMPTLMAASDAIVQNAGGLTTSEALAAGLPVLTYRCLPGHGRANAAVHARIGLVPWIRGRRDLSAARAAPGPARAGTALPAENPVPLLEKLLETA